MPTFLNERTAPCKPCLQSIPIRANEGAMRRALPLLSMLVPAPALAAKPSALGLFDGGGAFRAAGTPRCHATSGSESCRGRVCQYVENQVVAVLLKKKKQTGK